MNMTERRRYWSSEEEARLRRMIYNDGLTHRQVAERLGRSKQAVQYRCSVLGIRYSGPKRGGRGKKRGEKAEIPPLNPQQEAVNYLRRYHEPVFDVRVQKYPDRAIAFSKQAMYVIGGKEGLFSLPQVIELAREHGFRG